MGKLALTTTMTVDALIDVGEWYVAEGEHDRAAREQIGRAEAMVLGRKTFEGLAAYWSPLTGAWADLINPLPKYVASRTLRDPLGWNATLIEGEAAAGIARLKEELDGELFMSGCGELARHLLEHGVIDELRFWIHPVLGGDGARPLEGLGTTRLKLLDWRTFDSGVILLRYETG
jgi:dihydrofolate reductase